MPRIDDFRNKLPSSRRSPKLLEVDLALSRRDGEVIDTAQSYTALTAPADSGLRHDVELAKGKIEDPRYLYWADRLGLPVWGEMPSAYRFTRR
jgi:hypothetical protein